MPRKFKSTITVIAKRNASFIGCFLPKHLKEYLAYRANAESKTITQILIAIITKEIANDKFYKK